MLSMRPNRMSCVLCVLCATASLQVRAADPAGLAGSLIDDQTLAVVRVDLQKIDLDALVARIESTILDLAGPEALGQAKGDLEKFHAEAGARVKGFLAGRRQGPVRGGGHGGLALRGGAHGLAQGLGRLAPAGAGHG